MTNLIKNPILIGIIIATITYLYLKWKVDKKNKKKKMNKEVNLLIPLIAGAITSVIVYYYFNEVSHEQPPMITQLNIPNPMPDIGKTDALVDSMKSFHLIGRGVNVPNKLTGEFLEI